MNTKQLLKTIEMQGKKLREALLSATKASVAMNKAKSSAAVQKARTSISDHLETVQLAAEALEDAQYNWGLVLINDLKRAEIEAEHKKEVRDDLKAKKAADKRAEKEQIKGLSKDDIALAKKHKLLGRSPAGAAALTKFHLKQELAKVKAEAKTKKNGKTKKGPPVISSAQAIAAVDGQSAALLAQPMITMAPAAKAKLVKHVEEKVAKINRKREANKASIRKAAKKIEEKSFSSQVAEGLLMNPAKGRGKNMKGTQMPASITAVGQQAQALSPLQSLSGN